MLYIKEVKNSGEVVGLRVRMSSYRHEVSYESPHTEHSSSWFDFDWMVEGCHNFELRGGSLIKFL